MSFSIVLHSMGASGAPKILLKLLLAPARAKDLVEVSGVSEPTTFTRISGLKKAGLLRETLIAEDGRTFKGYELTDKARLILEHMNLHQL